MKKIPVGLAIMLGFFLMASVSEAALITYRCTSQQDRLTYQSTDCHVATTFAELPTAGLVAGQTATVAGAVNKNFIVNSDLVFVEVIDFSILVPTGNQILGVTSAGTASEMKSLLGTTNQVVITHGVGSITASLPQSIHSTANPTFGTVNLGSGGVDFSDGAAYGVSGVAGGRIKYSNVNARFEVSVQGGAYSGVGGVSSVSVVTANGLTGTVATPSTTPAITLTTNQTGILTGNGTAIAGITTSAGFGAQITDESGTGVICFTINCALVTPALGTPASGVMTNVTGLPISTGVSGLASGAATFLTTPTSANLLALVTNETGTNALVFSDNAVLVAPSIGAATGASLSLTGALTITGDNANPIRIAKSTVAVSAPGAGNGSFRFEAGTTTGTLKLVAYAGTGTTGSVILDNIGTGN